MSFQSTELCLLLVDENYGELPARIFAALMKHGRLRLPSIVQYTDLSFRQVQHGLAMLIQQSLVLWLTDESDSTFYEADWRSAYALARSGRFIRAVQARLGKDSGRLFQDCLLSQQFNVEDLEKARSARSGTVSKVVNGLTPKANGALSSPAPSSPKAMHDDVYRLLSEHYLCIPHSAHFRPEADNYVLAEEATRKTKTDWAIKIKKKDDAEFQAAIQTELRSWLQGSASIRADIKSRALHESNHGLKRRFEDDSEDEEVASKKPRLANGHTEVNGTPHVERHGDEEGPDHSIHRGILMRVNNNKFAVTARTDKLVQLAKERIGVATALVYSALLKLLEPDIFQCKEEKQDAEAEPIPDEDVQRRFTTLDIKHALPSSDDLEGGLANVEDSKIDAIQLQHRKEHRRRKTDKMDIDYDSDASHHSNASAPSSSSASDFDPRAETVRQHLLLLTQTSTPFVVRHPPTEKQPETWSVPFRSLAFSLLLSELNARILATHGPLGRRLARVLQEKGKLDEKTVQRVALAPERETRRCLMRLAAQGYLAQQEVPRDANRQAARALWLWGFEPERAARRVLDETYQAMSRCLQRLKAEREAVGDLLHKAGRTDVVGREEEMLGQADLEALQAWRGREERLLAEVARLDETVLVLRDWQGL